MSSLNKELIFLILQFLEDEKLKDAVHSLEKDSGLFFSMKYFEDSVINGELDEVEKYLLGFTKVEDNRHSMKIFFEIRKQKYLEALDKNDKHRALEILTNDLKVFSTFSEDLFKELTVLLTLPNFRENEQLSRYGDIKSARARMLIDVRKLLEANPLIREKLQFPDFKNARLQTLINQSLNWQHHLCKSPRPNPEVKSLFVDHTCGQANGAQSPLPVTNPFLSSMSKVGGFPLFAPHSSFQAMQTPPGTSLGGWMRNPSAVPHQVFSAGPINISAQNNEASTLKRPRTPPNNPAMEYQTPDSENLQKRPRLFVLSEEVSNPRANILPGIFSSQSPARAVCSSDDLPKTVVAKLNQGSAVKSMDFHPFHQTLLLVGTNIGDIAIWEVGTRERLLLRNFKVWEIEKCTMTLQATLATEYNASVNRVIWSPDGALIGAGYSKHIVHLYTYHSGEDLRNHLELDAHVGSVNDIAFATPSDKLCIVTCGEDKTIKVWDAADGTKRHVFEGHEAPVSSLCPHVKADIQFIFSTGIDGKIKAWLYDNAGSRVDYDAPGHSCTSMTYTADGMRLFSCGTTKEGESFIVEWNESEGAVKRTYHGLRNRSVGGVSQFDTSKRFLAAGDDFAIKFWDMDNDNVLTTTDAEGGLPASPCIRFNKEGSLLAVSTNENGVKILANINGSRLIRSIESRTLDASSKFFSVSAAKASVIGTPGASSSAIGKTPIITMMTSSNGDRPIVPELNPRINDELDKSTIWNVTVLEEPSQLRSLRLPDSLLAVRISRLIYTNSGRAILALAGNAVHKLWKWQMSNMNVGGKASVDIPPQLWQPSSGILMTNDISDTNLEEAIPCFALSSNDSYIVSSSGGKVSLFNMMTFKAMAAIMAPPPAATVLSFHPNDNNTIAFGMEDSSIQIYNVRVDEVKSKLKGHQKRVTGFAFSNALNILVSSGADAQLCVWNVDGWDKRTNTFLRIPSGRNPSPSAQTRVQFHQDQVHLLVVHETQLAVYVAPKLDCINQWVPPDSIGSITDAKYSCDSQSIYASFEDGSVYVFVAATLRERCRISPTAYLNTSPSLRVYPLAVAAHPTEPNQFAMGLSDGGVIVLEPLEGEGKWGSEPPLENGVEPSERSGSDQLSN